METDDIQHHKTNRQKRMTPRGRTLTWCNRCDRNMIYDGEKCPVCNSVQGPIKRRLKKETSARN